ncbi:MAG: hypothetical protein M3O01_12620 [Pseudomonadota bacterium]|nr:hypothetical protein [Pseudomonadota bacterium]
MSLSHRQKPVSPRRVRPAQLGWSGGASSLLRLTAPGGRHLPTAHDLGAWVGRAASVVLPVTGPHIEFPSFGA